MEVLSSPRFLISGVASDVGKSIVAVGLAVALRKRNISLSCSVVGSDLVEALILRRLTRRYVRSLDLKILSTMQVLNAVHHSSVGSDLVMIEGRAGLFDGNSAGALRGSDAEIAALTRTNVVLVVDARGLGNSIAALVGGYASFAQGFSLAGVIANRIDDSLVEPHDKTFFDAAMQGFGMQRLLGALPEINIETPLASDVVSQRSNRASLPLQFFIDVGNLVSEHVEIDRLIEIAGQALQVKMATLEYAPSGRKVRIAVSDDSCFSLCYQDNLELLRYYGAEIVPFSPLADGDLPKNVGAVYITGSALAEYGLELANNRSLRASIRNFADQGGILFSEGAGTAFLCDSFEYGSEGEFADGVGLIAGRARYDNQGVQYCDGVVIEDSVIGRAGIMVKGISSGEWRLEEDGRTVKTLRISRGGSPVIEEGYSPTAQSLSTFLFTHWGATPEIAKNIVDAAQIVANAKSPAS